MQHAKQGEASAALVAWGDGLLRCAERDGKLQPSTTPVPANLTAVSAQGTRPHRSRQNCSPTLESVTVMGEH